MKITNDLELTLYKVKPIDWDEIQIVAIDFQDLQKDLIEMSIEPERIEIVWEVYVTNWILKN
jgi:hypothetical protein